jgi:hypothetical protein
MLFLTDQAGIPSVICMFSSQHTIVHRGVASALFDLLQPLHLVMTLGRSSDIASLSRAMIR